MYWRNLDFILDYFSTSKYIILLKNNLKINIFFCVQVGVLIIFKYVPLILTWDKNGADR